MKARKNRWIRSLLLILVFLTTKLKTVKVEAPAERKAGVQVKSVDELVRKTKNEAKVI